jgi:prepilin-type N-terminal cleavage/methylation domain-containing protein
MIEDKRGFTLLELMVVVAMIAIVATIAFPRLDPFLPKRRLKSAARLLSGTITMAYGESIAENKIYRLYMDPSTDMYWITEVTRLAEEEESSGVVGLTIGTSFELLGRIDDSENIEETAPSEPMFAPKELPQGIHFSSVEVRTNRTSFSEDAKYIEFTPLGTASPAVINLINDEDEMFSVVYDGVTGMPTLVPQGERGG